MTAYNFQTRFAPLVESGRSGRRSARRAGCLLDGREWNEVPEVKA